MTYQAKKKFEGPVFRNPCCLVESDEDGMLAIKQSVLDEIARIDEPVNVVAIAGLYRTGKSYLMNRLAGVNKGFALGSTIQSKTKGIWVWCRPHPVHPNQTLVLLDTEGLGDVKKGDQNHDNWIFALATLLSSTLVYNTLGAFDQDTIDKLNFVTEISKHIKTRKTDNGDTNKESHDYDMYFPTFIIALRDFSLELEIDGREITPDEYLEDCLTLRPERDAKSEASNKPLKCIRRYFKDRKCFVFDRPGGRQVLKTLEDLTDADLSKDFVKELSIFCNFVHTKCGPKKLETGSLVTGRMFVTLVNTYVETIRNGAVPCIENALNSMALLENTKATEESVSLYRKMMENMIQMPTDTNKILSEAHHICIKEAVAQFLKKSIYDEGNIFQNKLNEQLGMEYQEYIWKNEEASDQKCKEMLRQLNTTIKKKLEDGTYTCNGGYALYQEDLQQLQTQYMATRGLGVKDKDVIATFLHDKWTEGQSILAADQRVTQTEKRAEEERQKVLQAKRDLEVAERETKLAESHAADVERMMGENIKQLEKRRKEDLENMEKHYEDVIQKRMTEQARTMKEGFTKDAKIMKSQIHDLTEAKKEMEQKYQKDVAARQAHADKIEKTLDDKQKEWDSQRKQMKEDTEKSIAEVRKTAAEDIAISQKQSEEKVEQIKRETGQALANMQTKTEESLAANNKKTEEAIAISQREAAAQIDQIKKETESRVASIREENRDKEKGFFSTLVGLATDVLGIPGEILDISGKSLGIFK